MVNAARNGFQFVEGEFGVIIGVLLVEHIIATLNDSSDDLNQSCL